MDRTNDNDSDNVVDLSAFRRQREEEEQAKAQDLADAQEEAAIQELEYLEELMERVVTEMADVYFRDNPDQSEQGYYPLDSGNDFYFHEAGYNEDGYYERSWQYDPWTEATKDLIDKENEENDEDF